jgi:hypothetical protein
MALECRLLRRREESETQRKATSTPERRHPSHGRPQSTASTNLENFPGPRCMPKWRRPKINSGESNPATNSDKQPHALNYWRFNPGNLLQQTHKINGDLQQQLPLNRATTKGIKGGQTIKGNTQQGGGQRLMAMVEKGEWTWEQEKWIRGRTGETERESQGRWQGLGAGIKKWG